MGRPDCASAARPVGVILAGGRSNRMGGESKALADLCGKPLLAHVIGRARPQVGRLLLSVERVSPAWDCFGLEQVADPVPGCQGPLGGLLAALRQLRDGEDWLLLLPCDAPFLPADLRGRLLERARAENAPGCVIRQAGHVQPTFSLWRRDLLPRLEQAVTGEGMAGFMQFLDAVEMAVLDWPDGAIPPPFYNVNDPAGLAQAGRWLQDAAGAAKQC